MLESIFITIMAMGFILFVLAIYEESIVFSATSLLMWIMVLAGVVYIEVAGGSSHSEIGMVGVALGFIFINVIWIIIQFMNFQKKRGLP